MITKQVIDELYKKYRRMPSNEADRHLDILRDFADGNVAVDIEDGTLYLYNIDPSSPFNEIKISHIHGVVDFEDCIAIVLHSSIVFLMKSDASAHVHIKMNPSTITEKIQWLFAK